MDNLKTKALGRTADLGSLYDIRTESFIPGIKFFNQNIPDALINTTDVLRTYYKVIHEDTISSKFNELELSGGLKISAMLGLVELKGSGKYLSEEKTSLKSVRATLNYRYQTQTQTINLSDSKFRDIVSAENFNSRNIGTHVVVGVDWGANVFSSFEHDNSENGDKSKIAGNLELCLKNIYTKEISGETAGGNKTNIENNFNRYKLTVNSDISFENSMHSWDEVKKLVFEIPNLVKANGGKGVPLEFTLMPLNEAIKWLHFTIQINILFRNPQEDTVQRVEYELSDFVEKKQKINDFYNDVDEQFFNKKELDELKNMRQNVYLSEVNFRKDLQTALVKMRYGKEDASALDNVLEKFNKEKESSIFIKYFLDDNLFRKRKNQIETEFKHNGFIYMKKRDSLQSLQARLGAKKAFVLIFSESMIEENKMQWNSNYQFFLDLSKDALEKNSEFYLYNSDIHSIEFTKISIYLYEAGRLKERDYYYTKEHLLTKAISRSSNLDYSLDRPANYYTVFLRCPNWKEGCANTKLNWICEKCEKDFQYGNDSRFYCNCGGADYTTFKFKCSNKNHPSSGFIEYEMREIQNELGIKYILEKKNKKYEGEVRNGKKHGKGTNFFANGDKYEGDYKDDKMNGKGTYFFASGNKYEGDWKDNEKNGKGIFYLAGGNKYEGDWKDNEKNGKGIFYLAGGNKYEGDFKNDKMNGRGIFFFVSGCKYEGYWKDDKMNGKGTYFFASGNKYEGDWKDSKMNGKGIYYFANGNKYEGDWKDNEKNGKGSLYLVRGGKYEGYWKDDKMNGKGIHFFASGNKYEGDWKDSKMNGKGIYYFANGEKYEGDWKDNEKNGKGKFYYVGGHKYKGDFRDDKMNGKGTYFLASGEKYEGDFLDDKMNGKGKFYYVGGSIYEGDFRDGIRDGRGILNFAGGGKYDGEWKDNIRNGSGIYFSNGSVYEGNYKDDKKHGNGTLYFNGQEKKGVWKDDKMIEKNNAVIYILLFLLILIIYLFCF